MGALKKMINNIGNQLIIRAVINNVNQIDELDGVIDNKVCYGFIGGVC